MNIILCMIYCLAKLFCSSFKSFSLKIKNKKIYADALISKITTLALKRWILSKLSSSISWWKLLYFVYIGITLPHCWFWSIHQHQRTHFTVLFLCSGIKCTGHLRHRSQVCSRSEPWDKHRLWSEHVQTLHLHHHHHLLNLNRQDEELRSGLECKEVELGWIETHWFIDLFLTRKSGVHLDL